MKFRCEHCGTKYSLSEETVRGRVLKIRCRQCKGVMVVRDPERSVGSEDSLSAADLRSYLSSSGEHPSGQQHDWFLAINGERQGPMTADEISARLAQGEVGATDHAWRAGMSGWLPLRDVPELAARLDKSGVSVVSDAVAAVLPSHAPTLPASQKKAPEPKKTPASQEARSPAEAPNPEPADTAPEPVERKPGAPPQPAWAKREVTDEAAAPAAPQPADSQPFHNEPSLSAIGEETRLFLMASGLQQGARRRMIISGVVIAALVGVVAGISMGWIPNPFGKGMQTADFKSSGQPSYVRLAQLGEKAGEDRKGRTVAAAAIIENLSYQDLVITQGWVLELMPLKDDRVELRLGRGNFSACAEIKPEAPDEKLTGAERYDCPEGHPKFQAFARTNTAQAALDKLVTLEALKTIREKFSEPNDQPQVAPYFRGESVNAAEGRAMLACLTGACRDAVLKEKLEAADRAVDRQMAKEARTRQARSEKAAAAVEEDPAAVEEARLRKKAKVDGADLARMAALQSALGTINLPLPEVSAPPGRASQLDVKAAAKVIGRGQRGVTACVSRAMTRGQSMFGELRARINIQPSGRVESMEVLTAPYRGTEVSRCIQSKVRRWRFPSFPGKEMVPVEVPWKLPKR